MNQPAVPIELNHNPDVSRRFIIFDMFDTLVKLRSDIGKYDILEVLHRMYLQEYDFDEVRALYDGIVDKLISERRSEDLEVVFVEILEYIFDGLGISGHDLAEVEEVVFEDEDDCCCCDCDDDDCDCDCCCDDEDDEFFEVECPACGEVINVDEGILESGSIECPNCGENLEFDIEYDDEEEDED